MAFHVTQCPSCESTFNTNAQVLEAASGRVRCGSCLSVFDALDNFVQPDDATEQESVFVGSHPEGYFNPSAFLTRSSLQDSSSKTPSPVKPTFPDRAALFGNIVKSKPALEIYPEPVQEQAPLPETSQQVEVELEAAVEEVEEVEEVEVEIEIGMEAEVEVEVETEAHSSIAAKISAPESDETLGDHAGFAEDSEESSAEGSDVDESDQSPEDVTLSVSFSMQQPSTTLPNGEMTSGEREAPVAPEPQENIDLAQSSAQQSKASISESDTVSEPVNEDIHRMESAAELALRPYLIRPLLKVPSLKVPELEETISNVDDSSEGVQNEFWDSTEERQRVFEEAIRDNAELDVSAGINELITEVITDPGSELSASARLEQASEHDDTEWLTAVESSFELASDSLESEFVIEELTTDEIPAEAEAEAEAENVSTEDIRARALNAEFEDDDALEVIPDLNLEELGNMAAPVTLGSARRLHWRSTLTLAFGCIVLSCTLLAQYFWWYLPLYSQSDRYRAAYVFVCEYISCQLPPYSNLDAIRSDDLAVRSHPEQQNALSINVSFRNTANFAQAFPVMILSFNSSANEIIALREFSPQEYLSPGLQSVTDMPPNTPVQVQLEIMDPGPFAVNYTLAFRNP